MLVLVTRFVAESKTSAYLIHRVDEYLCVLRREATDRFILFLPRKRGLDQGGEFTEEKCASTYGFGGYSVAVGKERLRNYKQSM